PERRKLSSRSQRPSARLVLDPAHRGGRLHTGIGVVFGTHSARRTWATATAKVLCLARLLLIPLSPVLPVLSSALEHRVPHGIHVQAALVGFAAAIAHPPSAPLDPMVVPACQD